MKILPPDKVISVWLDSNIKLLIDKESFVEEFLGDSDIGAFKHPERNTVAEEVEAIRTQKEYASDRSRRQSDKHKKLGFKDNQGLYECGVLVIRHSEKTRAFCEDWWEEIQSNPRDQVSLPYILSKHNIKLKANLGNVRNHKFFKYE